MEDSSLSDLISVVESGNAFHISVVFLKGYGNEKTKLTQSQTIHTCPVCDFAKSTAKGLERCVKCRNRALAKAIDEKRAFGGYCVNGVFEYCRPIISNDDVLAVIFIGNILLEDGIQRAKLLENFDEALIEIMARDFSYSDAEQVGNIIESYTRFLLEKYYEFDKAKFNPLIENIKNHIGENLMYPLCISELAKIFNYNEKYMGRLFKKETGLSIREYINLKKIKTAKRLLRETKKTVTEISLLVGFNNVTYFNRVFKREEGLSPCEYRNSIK